MSQSITRRESMTAAKPAKNRIALWLLIGGGLALVAGANAHLVYVASVSQPDCISHLRPGESSDSRSTFSAAKSSCTPR
jgi:hypothetical protein